MLALAGSEGTLHTDVKMVSLLLARRLQRERIHVSCLRVMVPILQWASFEAREGALLSAGVFT